MSDFKRIERRLKLPDLRVLMSVVEQGSMRRAASHLGTSQPAVSRSIADLEHSLGVPLLDRNRRGIEPTPYGRALIKRGLAALDELGQVINDIQFLTDPTAGEVRIAAPIAIATGFAMAVIDKLTRRHPRIVCRVMIGEAPVLHRALEERNVDILISRILSPIMNNHLDIETLYDDRPVVAASADSAWSRRRRVNLAELVNDPWTLPSPGTLFGSMIADAFLTAGLDLPRTTGINDAGVARLALVAKGRFFTVAFNSALRFVRGDSPIKALPVELLMTQRPVAIITLKNRTLAPVARLFIDCAREVAKPPAGRKSASA
jgi:DNA-binding transcriptional LysR family regulator